MQVDSFSKIIFVHIPRAGGSWFGYSWRSHYDGRGDYNLRNGYLVNNKNKKETPIGRHGTIKGIKEKFKIALISTEKVISDDYLIKNNK